MEWIYADGGRSNYFKGQTGDCVCRAICNATGKDYKEIYNLINSTSKSERIGKRKRRVSNARNGVFKTTFKKIIENELGWVWHPTMQIGSGCTTHLTKNELPSGNLIVSLSGHLTCVKDGVLYDTYDCSRDGGRCVYGYWVAPTKEQPKAKKDNKALIAKKKAEIDKVKAKYQVKIKNAEKQLKTALKQVEKKYDKLMEV